MKSWINKNTEVYCSFAKQAGDTGCQIMNTGFYYYGLNKIYKSFSVENIKDAVKSVKTLDIKGFAVTMPFKKAVLEHVDKLDVSAYIGAANTVINTNHELKAYNTDYLAAIDYLQAHYEFGRNLYILGNGGYALAVKAASDVLKIKYINITRDNWGELKSIKGSIIYNCTPVKTLENFIHKSNTLIDCITNTTTGKILASLQASYQFKLYTGLELPLQGMI